VVEEVDRALGSLVDACGPSTAPRTRPEFLYELLVLGVLWQVYAERAIHLPTAPQRVLSRLGRWRQRAGFARPVIDALRGALATLFLARNGHSRDHPALLTPDHLGRLLDWLDATGDFDQEVERLRGWHRFLSDLPEDESRRHLADIATLAKWFDRRSLEVLGCYTAQVETFLAEKLPHYRWREDVIFCGRQRVEYHLGMVGTAIMNRAFRSDFLATGQKIVLVPPCMRAHLAEQCQAQATPFGARCAGCEPGCHVHQATRLGEKRGFQVFMLPDELSSLSPGAGSREALAGLGIVGVSCALTNAQGGWKTRDLGIPAQGLLLDYCGCSWHWNPEGGIPTDLNFHHLLRVLDLAPEQVSEK
jgi:hypothetical protein